MYDRLLVLATLADGGTVEAWGCVMNNIRRRQRSSPAAIGKTESEAQNDKYGPDRADGKEHQTCRVYRAGGSVRQHRGRAWRNVSLAHSCDRDVHPRRARAHRLHGGPRLALVDARVKNP